MSWWERFRSVANWVNLSTPGGLALAGVTGCRVVAGENGLHHALGYTPRLPLAGAFTVGNVVFFREHFPEPAKHPRLLAHEATHATQYALCLGLPFIPLYFLAAGYSWLRTGDPASRNLFERLADLTAGGYRERPARNPVPRTTAALRRVFTGPPISATGRSGSSTKP